MNNPSKKCIFCEKNGKLSKEHAFPNWLKRRLPANHKSTKHYTTYLGSEPSSGKLQRPGAVHRQTLKVVCRECNSGWMGDIQEEAKPNIIKLLEDRWDHIDLEGFYTLSRWAVMFSMVKEFADPKTAVIPQNQRTAFMNNREVPKDWFIWLGRYNSKVGQTCQFNHFGLKKVTTNGEANAARGAPRISDRGFLSPTTCRGPSLQDCRANAP